MAITNGRVRTVGHAYTLWTWGQIPIAYCTNVTHNSPSPLSQPVEVQPLNHVRPIEIVTGRAITGGQISMTVTQLYGKEVWEHFGNSFGDPADPTDTFDDLADVFHKVQRDLTEHSGAKKQIKLLRVIRPPGSGVYVTQYMGVRITDIREDETTTPDALLNSLSVTVRYAYKKNVANGAGLLDEVGGDPATLPQGGTGLV